ncbi:MAG: CRISPR-associated endonuclease Cas1 [Verrucomicrobiales bacterium]|nr:CRISPR-associated endonuclease Cas1 [Verrucomicrobiales bacterium]
MSEQPLIPVRRLHNYAYCPRLFYYQWVEDLFVENADTIVGKSTHRNVDKPSSWKDDLDLSDRASLRSLHLSSETLGIVGVIDLIEDTESGHELLDYKKGSSRKDEHGIRIAKRNDILQIAAYALLLREHGMAPSKASVYYAQERRRVSIELTEQLYEQCRNLITEARLTALSTECPPPLLDDPRCLHCSAYCICLPNESAFWSGALDVPLEEKEPPRPPGDEGESLILQEPRAYVGKRAGAITVKIDTKIISKHPIEQLQAVYLYGGIQVSTQALHSMLEHDIPVAYFSPAGRFLGLTSGLPTSGIDARLGQARLIHSPEHRLALAREIIRAKINNQRVLLMRNGQAPDVALKQLANLRDKTMRASDLDELRGLEGNAAAQYFSHFGTMLKGSAFENFNFEKRNRRPPRDPVNSLLSQGYSILAKELTGICHAVGLDPFIGVFHQPRYGRPALALDLMEEFRPLIVDSVVISLLNRNELELSDFTQTSRGTFLTNEGRRQFWRAWFRRMDTEVKHPQFGYRMTYRRMLDVQVRQLWRYLRGETKTYYGFTTR